MPELFKEAANFSVEDFLKPLDIGKYGPIRIYFRFLITFIILILEKPESADLI